MAIVKCYRIQPVAICYRMHKILEELPENICVLYSPNSPCSCETHLLTFSLIE